MSLHFRRATSMAMMAAIALLSTETAFAQCANPQAGPPSVAIAPVLLPCGPEVAAAVCLARQTNANMETTPVARFIGAGNCSPSQGELTRFAAAIAEMASMRRQAGEADPFRTEDFIAWWNANAAAQIEARFPTQADPDMEMWQAYRLYATIYRDAEARRLAQRGFVERVGDSWDYTWSSLSASFGALPSWVKYPLTVVGSVSAFKVTTEVIKRVLDPMALVVSRSVWRLFQLPWTVAHRIPSPPAMGATIELGVQRFQQFAQALDTRQPNTPITTEEAMRAVRVLERIHRNSRGLSAAAMPTAFRPNAGAAANEPLKALREENAARQRLLALIATEDRAQLENARAAIEEIITLSRGAELLANSDPLTAGYRARMDAARARLSATLARVSSAEPYAEEFMTLLRANSLARLRASGQIALHFLVRGDATFDFSTLPRRLRSQMTALKGLYGEGDAQYNVRRTAANLVDASVMLSQPTSPFAMEAARPGQEPARVEETGRSAPAEQRSRFDRALSLVRRSGAAADGVALPAGPGLGQAADSRAAAQELTRRSFLRAAEPAVRR